MNNCKKLTDFFTLKNGVQIPCVGYGTFKTPDGETAVMAVKTAIEKGFRHIDAAAIYKNEESVGQAIKESGINRKKLFITSKVWNTERGYEKTKLAFEKTMNDLQLGYLDLYLIHWPASSSRFRDWDEINLQTWKAITELYKVGRIRAIGVSNFLSHHMESLMKTEVPPMVNQIEYHPGWIQDGTVQYCRENNILVEAWSPLGTGTMLTNPTLIQIAEKYQKSVAQICYRWCLQNGVLPLSKSITPSRIEENTKIFDFNISEEDMLIINSFPHRNGSGEHPDVINC